MKHSMAPCDTCSETAMAPGAEGRPQLPPATVTEDIGAVGGVGQRLLRAVGRVDTFHPSFSLRGGRLQTQLRCMNLGNHAPASSQYQPASVWATGAHLIVDVGT